jgi:hypothetical protein
VHVVGEVVYSSPAGAAGALTNPALHLSQESVMRISKRWVVAVLLASAAIAAPAARAQEKAKAEPSPDERAIMERYMKAAMPGPVHQKMAKLAGKWKLQVTSWMAPGAPPQKSEGSAEFKTILGGRYLQQEVRSSFGDQPFEGMGIEGFDNVTKERFGTWFDNMSTGVMVSRGKCAADAKKCTFKGRMSDAVAGKEVVVTEIMAMTDDDHFTFEMHGPGPGGKTFKMMEIAYTRQ